MEKSWELSEYANYQSKAVADLGFTIGEVPTSRGAQTPSVAMFKKNVCQTKGGVSP